MSAVCILRKRNAAQGGDPRESERLRFPYLRRVGMNRTSTSALLEDGIDVNHGLRWLSGTGVLADRYQVIVRRVLGGAGGAP